VRQPPEKPAPTGCAECHPANDRTPFCLVDFVAQKVHFRIGAKRVLEEFDEIPEPLAPVNLLESQCDEVDNRDHQALQAG
jgi:hypothetical protein